MEELSNWEFWLEYVAARMFCTAMYLHFAQQCTYIMFLNLFFHVLKGIFIVDLSRQQIEKGKRVFFKSEYDGLKLYFLQAKVILDSVLFLSEILTASVEQLLYKGATERRIKTWADLWGRSNWFPVSSGTMNFVLLVGEYVGEGNFCCLTFKVLLWFWSCHPNFFSAK